MGGGLVGVVGCLCVVVFGWVDLLYCGLLCFG